MNTLKLGYNQNIIGLLNLEFEPNKLNEKKKSEWGPNLINKSITKIESSSKYNIFQLVNI